MSSTGPRCPNHRVVLIKTTTPGIGICPISDARFEYKAVEGTRKRKLNTAGQVVETTDYKVTGND